MSSLNHRGRPPASSRETLQDAAFDLFIEKSYAKTTISDITHRAGVSRATFFNYFDSKSDVLWVECDTALACLREALERHLASNEASSQRQGLALVHNALEHFADTLSSQKVPFALTQYELIGSIEELQASAMRRFGKQAQLITEFLRAFGHSESGARSAAYALIAATVAALQQWASGGPARGRLDTYVTEAIGPLTDAFVARAIT